MGELWEMNSSNMVWNQPCEKSKQALSHGHTSNTIAKNKDEKKPNVYLDY